MPWSSGGGGDKHQALDFARMMALPAPKENGIRDGFPTGVDRDDVWQSGKPLGQPGARHKLPPRLTSDEPIDRRLGGAASLGRHDDPQRHVEQHLWTGQ